MPETNLSQQLLKKLKEHEAAAKKFGTNAQKGEHLSIWLIAQLVKSRGGNRN